MKYPQHFPFCSVVEHSYGSKKFRVLLTFTDIHSLYPGNGLSDAIIDFFSRLVHYHHLSTAVYTSLFVLFLSRTMLQGSNQLVVLSSLTYERANSIMGDKNVEKRK